MGGEEDVFDEFGDGEDALLGGGMGHFGGKVCVEMVMMEERSEKIECSWPIVLCWKTSRSGG